MTDYTRSVRIGDNSPWGKIDLVQDVAPGVQFVSTPSHGGVHLDKCRRQMMPKGWHDEWWEEDCCAVVPFAVFSRETLPPRPFLTKKALRESLDRFHPKATEKLREFDPQNPIFAN